MKKKLSSATERLGVNFVRTVVESANCIFQEIDRQNDFGNDALIQLVEGENVRAECVGAQIKSGDSYVDGGMCKIPASQSHFGLWSQSSFPIVGIVYNVAEKLAYWTNITSRLQSERQLIREGPYTIKFNKTLINRFDSAGFADFFIPQFLNRPIVLDFNRSSEFLLSNDPSLHGIGLRSLLYGHRKQLAVWDMFFQILKDRSPERVSPFLVHCLALIPGHGDIFWHAGNEIPEPLRKELVQRIAFLDENQVANLLWFVGDSDFGRGTIGQDVYAVIDIVPGKVETLKRIVGDESRPAHTRCAAVSLVVFYEQLASVPILEHLSAGSGELAEWAAQLAAHLHEFGEFSLW
jgi:hypothetical protein